MVVGLVRQFVAYSVKVQSKTNIPIITRLLKTKLTHTNLVKFSSKNMEAESAITENGIVPDVIDVAPICTLEVTLISEIHNEMPINFKFIYF